MKRSLLKGSRGPKGRRSGGRRRCSGGGGGGVCFGGVFGVKGGINEREGAGRGRRSAGQERHGSEAALLGAGEASEEVTMDVVLSRCSGGGVGGCVCVVVVEYFGLQLSINISARLYLHHVTAACSNSRSAFPRRCVRTRCSYFCSYMRAWKRVWPVFALCSVSPANSRDCFISFNVLPPISNCQRRAPRSSSSNDPVRTIFISRLS